MTRLRVTLSLAVVLLTCGVCASSASAAHYYLQMEGGEEFEKITETKEATFSSNALMTFRAGFVEISCHFTGRQKLFTTGKGEITEFILNTCALPIGCTVTLKPFKLPAPTELLEVGSEPVLYREKIKEFRPKFEVSFCAAEGVYTFGSVEGTSLEGEITNELGVEVHFPQPMLAGTKLASNQEISGIWKLTPTMGRQLAVGP